MNDNEQLDNLLDEALGEYREAEPLAGIEDRVLQRLRMEPRERRMPWWKWGAVAACAALVLMAVWIGLRNRHDSFSPVQSTQAQKQESKSPVATTEAGSQQPVIAARVATTPPMRISSTRCHPAPIACVETASASELRTPQFPTPAPLTPEEHALLALLKSNPEALPNRRENPGDMTISPLEIMPLAGSAAPTQENSNE
jgi:hypothetical protein